MTNTSIENRSHQPEASLTSYLEDIYDKEIAPVTPATIRAAIQAVRTRWDATIWIGIGKRSLTIEASEGRYALGYRPKKSSKELHFIGDHNATGHETCGIGGQEVTWPRRYWTTMDKALDLAIMFINNESLDMQGNQWEAFRL